MTGGNTNHYTTADLSSGFGAPRWPLFVLPGRPPRPRTQRARNAKTTKSKNKHKKANSEKSPSGAQSPAFRGVRPEMRRSPGGQGQAKNSTKKTTKNKQSPRKQGQKKIAGGAQTPAFQRVRPEMRRSPGTRKARKSKNEKSKNSTVEPKSFCGFFGLCLRQLLALRASPPAPQLGPGPAKGKGRKAKHSTNKSNEKQAKPQKARSDKNRRRRPNPCVSKGSPGNAAEPRDPKGERKQNRKSENSAAGPKSCSGVFGRCLRQLFALRASPPASQLGVLPPTKTRISGFGVHAMLSQLHGLPQLSVFQRAEWRSG